jgi:restriction endonuclease S subunit
MPLQELVIKQIGDKPIHLSTVSTPDSLPYLGIEAIEKGEIKQYADRYSTVHSTEQDIFVVRTGGRNGLILKGKNGAVGSTIHCLTPLWIDGDYLYYFLKLNEFKNSGERDLLSSFWNIQVPIISLEEQRKISNNIREALSVFDAQNRDAELKLIISLKSLVNITSETLDKIQNLDDFKKAVLELVVSEKLIKSSSRWETFKISTLFKVQTGSTPLRSNSNYWDNGNICWIKSGEVNNSFINNSEEYITEIAVQNANVKVLPADTILIALYGEGKTRGQVGLLKIRASINQAVAGLINEEMPLDTKIFIYYSLINQYNSLRKKADGGVRHNLSSETIKNIEVKLPSISEQTEIIALIESLFRESEEITKNYTLEAEQNLKLQKAVISSFYDNLYFDEDDTFISEIKLARNKKNLEIENLRKKQKQFRFTITNLPKMEIIDVLKSSEKPMNINELWEKSKYQKWDIDDFYENLKKEYEKGVISWELTEQNSEAPQSFISLTDAIL